MGDITQRAVKQVFKHSSQCLPKSTVVVKYVIQECSQSWKVIHQGLPLWTITLNCPASLLHPFPSTLFVCACSPPQPQTACCCWGYLNLVSHIWVGSAMSRIRHPGNFRFINSDVRLHIQTVVIFSVLQILLHDSIWWLSPLYCSSNLLIKILLYGTGFPRTPATHASKLIALYLVHVKVWNFNMVATYQPSFVVHLFIILCKIFIILPDLLPFILNGQSFRRTTVMLPASLLSVLITTGNDERMAQKCSLSQDAHQTDDIPRHISCNDPNHEGFRQPVWFHLVSAGCESYPTPVTLWNFWTAWFCLNAIVVHYCNTAEINLQSVIRHLCSCCLLFLYPSVRLHTQFFQPLPLKCSSTGFTSHFLFDNTTWHPQMRCKSSRCHLMAA